MDIERIDFHSPVELQTVWRTPDTSGKVVEYRSEIVVPWEYIDAIQTYPYPDDWEQLHGPKYYITLAHGIGTHIVLGDYFSMKHSFITYRQHISRASYGD